MVSDISTIFKKLTSAIIVQSHQITKEIGNANLQISYFEKNIKLIKSSKYYRFINFIKNIFNS